MKKCSGSINDIGERVVTLRRPKEGGIVKIIVIGGTGRIGSKVVTKLRDPAFEAVAASPNSGVNTITGEGVAQVLTGAAVVVDVSNSPSSRMPRSSRFSRRRLAISSPPRRQRA